MFDVSKGQALLFSDAKSICNRIKLLLLTDPTEMHMNPNFGVGLRKYMFNYNNENTIARIKDNLVEQLRLWEPAVDPDKTVVKRSTSSGGSAELDTSVGELNKLKLTISVTAINSDVIQFEIDQSDIEKFV